MKRQELVAILEQCSHKDWRLIIGALNSDDPWEQDFVRFHWYYTPTCSKTGDKLYLHAPVHRASVHWDERTVIHEVRESIQEIYRHEADEFFRYKGVMIFDPHIGDPGYVPERTARTLQKRIPSSRWSATFTDPNSCDPSRVGSIGDLYEIDPADYTRFR